MRLNVYVAGRLVDYYSYYPDMDTGSAMMAVVLVRARYILTGPWELRDKHGILMDRSLPLNHLFGPGETEAWVTLPVGWGG